MATMSLGKALNSGLRRAMEHDPKVVLMGEDIGKLGGVFRVTEGLQRDFGDRRVIDTPLAESGVIGTAVGLALRGYRPVCEIQFDGFIYPAFDQIVSQVAKLHYRNEGRVTVPLTIRVPFGGGVGAVEHHSESPEAYFAHTAGLRVVTPSNAADGYRMIQQAIASDDPVVFFEPKRRYWEKGDVEDETTTTPQLAEVPLGRAAILREGSDVTIAAYGPMVATALDAARIAEEEGTSLEVIDLRSLSPDGLRHLGGLGPEDGAHGGRPRGERVLRARGRDRGPDLRAVLLPSRGAGPPGRWFRHAVPRLAGGAPLPSRRRPHPARGGPVPPAMSTHRQFVLPDLGEGLTEAEVVAWHVAVGDEVTLNQVLVEVETEKAVVELPSPFAGTVVELLASAGETVRVGAPLITIDSAAAPTANSQGRDHHGRGRRHRGEGADARRLRAVRCPAEPAPAQRQRASRADHRCPGPPAERTKRTRAAPAKPLAAPPVRFMARQNGVDLADVTGHGPDGIITREDLAAHLAGADQRTHMGHGGARHERPYAASRSTWPRP